MKDTFTNAFSNFTLQRLSLKDHHTVEMCMMVRQRTTMRWARLPQTTDIKDFSVCCEQQVQKPGSVMVSGYMSALGKSHFHLCDDSGSVQKSTEILEQLMLPSRQDPKCTNGCLLINKVKRNNTANNLLHTAERLIM